MRSPRTLRVIRAATAITTIAIVLAALAVRGPQLLVGVAIAALLFVPLERLFALRRQRILRRGLGTDLVHLIADNLLTAAATIGLAIAALVSTLPLSRAARIPDLVAALPAGAQVALALAIVIVGQYCGHRLAHTVPFLWRLHAVHHSIDELDWVAAARVHPLDQAFTQVWFVVPLALLGFDASILGAGVLFFTANALFIHANVRIRIPLLRWLVPTPEWHHWHHSRDPNARETNFGFPVVDVLLGTAHLPRGRRAEDFGCPDPVPPTGYLRQLAYPFRRPGRTVGSICRA